MIERQQQLITAAIVATALGWPLLCLSQGWPVLAAIGLVVLLLGHAVVLAIELAMMQIARHGDGLAFVPWRDLAKAWLSEIWCAPRVFCWRQPFRTHAWPDRLTGVGGQRGLLLVHGFLCNRAVWNDWYPKLRARGIPHLGVSLEPAFGGIDEYFRQIDAAVSQLTHSTGLAPVIVAHSMGGLAVRGWLRAEGPTALRRVHRLVTLATPHHGTALVKIGLCENVRQMALGSDWIERLNDGDADELRDRLICVFSRCDNVVFPACSAWLEGATVVEVERCAHIQMVDHPEVFRLVARQLAMSPATNAVASAPDR